MNKNPIIGGFEDAIERGQSAVSSAAKQTAKDFTNSATTQLTGSAGQNSLGGGQGTNEQASAAKQQMSDDAAKQFLKDLYGPTKKAEPEKPAGAHPISEALGVPQSENNVSHPVTEALGVPQVDPNAGKTPEEIAKMQKLRSQLQQDYYEKLVKPPKPAEKPVTEKLDEEKQMEALELQKKEEKLPGPLQQVKPITGERMIGVSG